MNELRSIAFDDGYGRGPRELIRDANLSMGARLLWIVLEDMTSSNSLRPFPGQELLAEHLGCTARHVRNLLGELEDAGWLLVTRRGVTKTNLYTLIRPGTERKQSSGHKSDRKQSSGQERNSTSGQERNQSSYKAKPVEAEPVEAPPPPPTRNPRPARNKGRGGIEHLKQEALDAGWTTFEWDRLLSFIARDGTIRSPKAFIRHRIANDDKPIVVEMF